jgi:DNA-directed RNA polymerase sigma subunit (sigma70/sigma32)
LRVRRGDPPGTGRAGFPHPATREDGEERTLQQVAEGLGLSRERVSQLEKRALDRLLLAASEADLDDWVHG